MGTRSITTVRSRWGADKPWKTNATIYRHWDGYLDGHGADLHSYLDGLPLVNGINDNTPRRRANGPGQVAAILVADMYAAGHDPSLEPEGLVCGQEYHYVVDVDYGPTGGTIALTVYDGPVTAFGMGGENCTKKIFSGTVEEFGEFLKKQSEMEEA